jgi:hypothetical protein
LTIIFLTPRRLVEQDMQFGGMHVPASQDDVRLGNEIDDLLGVVREFAAGIQRGRRLDERANDGLRRGEAAAE